MPGTRRTGTKAVAGGGVSARAAKPRQLRLELARSIWSDSARLAFTSADPTGTAAGGREFLDHVEFGLNTGTSISWANLSIGLSSKASLPRFQQLTISCPW
jgi:hypothetical protein